MASMIAAVNPSLRIVSYNMHGFMQGLAVVEDLIASDNKPDVFLLQEHWLTPANLVKFDHYFPGYFSFGCSAMSNCVQSDMLRGRPFGGVVTLIKKELRNHVESLYCEERYSVVRVANYFIANIYLPCSGSTDRLFICEEILANVSALYDRYRACECLIAGDFNVNLDSSDPVAVCINKFLLDCSLYRCDDIFPLQKSMTYRSEALGHESCIDYILVSDAQDVLAFMVDAPDINFSDHLPLIAVIKCTNTKCTNTNKDKPNGTNKPAQEQLRWDKGDIGSFYRYTDCYLSPLLYKVEGLLSQFDEHTFNVYNVDISETIDSIYNDIVEVLSSGASACIPTHSKNFFKFWWNEELSRLKEASVHSNRVWIAAGRPRSGQIFERRQSCRLQYRRGIKEREKCSADFYTNDLHEALMKKNSTDFWKCWKSKFGSSNNCQQVEGCVDNEIIADKFCCYFMNTYNANNAGRANELENAYFSMREKYCGLPTLADNYFTTEAVSRIILHFKRGKAADIDGLTAEHLQYSHPVVSVLLAKLFALIALSRRIPAGFKRSYIVPIPKINDCRSKALGCEDFRGIAISPILSKVFENCLLAQLQAFVDSNDNQFGFKKGIGCPHAIYTVRTVIDRWISQGFTVNLCAIDLSKAFDKVNHHSLFIKLMKRNIPVQLLHIVENLFTGCLTSIKWFDTWSAEFMIEFGVRQGSVLSPFLFAILVDDIAALDNFRCKFHVVLYADDILLFTPTVTGLEKLLHACERELLWLDMSVNFKKSCCLRIGPRCDIGCAEIVSLSGQVIPWTNEMRYLGVRIIKSRVFRCSLTMAKRSFYRAANSIFGKVGRIASEEVTLHLLETKCIPVLLYGLEACPLTKNQLSSIDFVVNRFFMKLFKSSNIAVINECQKMFSFQLPSERLRHRTSRFLLKVALVDNKFIKYTTHV